MTTDTHRRLRDATHERHQRLEAKVDILGRIATTAGRRELVTRFLGLHTAVEAAVAPFLDPIEGLDFAGRRRSARLAADLTSLGGRPGSPSGAPVRVTGAAEALGLMYVLEGSSLGGRVIRRHVEAAGGDMVGLGFLDPYGPATGERWRSFLRVLDAEPDVDALVGGAVAGFGHAERRLCDVHD